MIRSTPFNDNLEGIDGKEMIKFADNLVSLILYFLTYVPAFICAKYPCLVPPLSSCVRQASRTTYHLHFQTTCSRRLKSG